MTYLGNISLLDQPKHGFLCSRTTKSTAILPCLDWAVEMSHASTPIMSTFHSDIEDAVLDMLLRGTCPIILVLGRSLYKKIPDKLQKAHDDNRLLIISLSNQSRISKESAQQCNTYICENSSTITFGYVSEQSSLYPLYQKYGKENN